MRILDLELKRGDARFKEGIEREIHRAERRLESGDRAGLSRQAQDGADGKGAQALLWLRKQDSLLYVCTYLLLNVAEDLVSHRRVDHAAASKPRRRIRLA